MSEDTNKNKIGKHVRKHKFCRDGGFWLRLLTYVSNMALIVLVFFLLMESYGLDRFFVSLGLLPPLLSLWSLSRQGDREERNLEKRIRKARLRKELNDLSDFDRYSDL